MKNLLIVSVVILIALGFIVGYVLFFEGSHQGGVKEYILIIEKGDNLYTIAKKLKSNGIIKNEFAFVILGRLWGIDKKLVPTAYKFNNTMSLFKIVDDIANERIYTIRVRIPEGSTMYQVDEIFAEVGFTKRGDILEVVTNRSVIEKYGIRSDRLEGYLFPSTYFVPFYYKDKPEEIVNMLVKTFFKKVNREEYERMARNVGLTFEQAVTLASIIEKEAGKPKEEKYLVSSVFHNRLRKRMQLASCATVIYGLMDKGMWHDNNLKKWHLSYDTPYNTYIRLGLPKSPICNPSLESLKAAVMPANTDYFYFVSKNNGTHVFSRTYKEHLNYVKMYQIDYWKYRK
jgi:UPF0755 protein